MHTVNTLRNGVWITNRNFSIDGWENIWTTLLLEVSSISVKQWNSEVGIQKFYLFVRQSQVGLFRAFDSTRVVQLIYVAKSGSGSTRLARELKFGRVDSKKFIIGSKVKFQNYWTDSTQPQSQACQMHTTKSLFVKKGRLFEFGFGAKA